MNSPGFDVLPAVNWPWLFGLVSVLFSSTLSLHVLLRPREAPSASLWLLLIWLLPLGGGVLYLLFGINLLKRRAILLRRRIPAPAPDGVSPSAAAPATRGLDGLSAVLDRVTGQPLQTGHAVEMYAGGDAAYRAMLAAIGRARRSVALSSFIFSADRIGRAMIAALGAAAGRGVEVRVLIDGAGRYYSPPLAGGSAVPALRRAGVQTALFLHSMTPWRMPYINLRNHRKLLIVDGETAFTGGMNISDQHTGSRPRSRDVHFAVRGPAVAAMHRVFAADWRFATDEVLAGEAWEVEPPSAGEAAVRVIPDGPDEDIDQCRWAFLAALGAADRQVLIVTPYFLPDNDLLMALRHTALRGVTVDIVLPEYNNWPVVNWAMHNRLPPLIGSGCRIWYGSDGFDHSKYLVIDQSWALIGSANWDPRSLRLNFELNLEIHCPQLAAALHALARARLAAARRIEMDEIENRGFLPRLRDGLAGLLTPYL